jgi:hypothetical protein
MALRRFGHGAKQQFMRGNEQALYGNLPQGSDIGQASNVMGKQALAEKLAGTTDKKSRKYRNARDYISRHLGGRRRSVNPDYERKVTGVLRGNKRESVRGRGNLTVSIAGEIKVSSKTWKGKMSKTLDASETRAYLDAIDKGDGNEAMGIFLEAYGIGRDVAEVRYVNSVTFE